MDYRREIDGLRALAVLPVILFHAGFAAFGGGFVGVDVFFVISGYLITTIILAELAQGKFSIANFYERRAKRILPALFLVMLASIPFAWLLLLPQDLVSFAKSLASISFFGSNVFFWSERGYFGTATEFKPLIHTWSLAVEEQYYLFFPLLLIFFAGKRKIFRPLLVLMLSVSFVFCVWLVRIHQDSAFFLLPTRLWELLVGSIVAIILFENKDRCSSVTIGKLASVAEVVGLLLILFSVFFYDKDTIFPSYTTLAPVLGTALIISCATSTSIVGKILAQRVLVFVGLLSYSAYLWHQPIFAFAKHYKQDISNLQIGLMISLTFVLSYFSWKYVEQPWRKSGSSRKTIFAYSVAGLALFTGLGIAGVLGNGFLNRFSKDDSLILSNSISAGEYVSRRFDDLKHAPFNPESKAKRILIIGDSYGKDLVNALYEGGLSDVLQISTHQINSECGNLYLKEDFTSRIEPDKLPRCRTLGWYEGGTIRKLIEQSDAIFLASAWSRWVAELLPQSVANLEKDFGKPVFVFGTKNFGLVTTKGLLAIPKDKRAISLNEIDPASVEVQGLMRRNLEGKRFIDIGPMICGLNTSQCRLFNDLGEPLTFDGGHLAKAGAKQLGKALAEIESSQKLFATVQPEHSLHKTLEN